MTDYQRLRLEISDHIAQIVMVSENGMNTMDMQLMQELTNAFSVCEENTDVRAVLLRSEGRAFCGGGDIRYLAEGVKDPDFTMQDFVYGLSILTMRMKRCPKPIVAVVHGAAAGSGCNLALACDMIFADKSAKFIEAFVNIGLTPDTCGAFWLPRLVGSARAFEILATGRVVDAQEAADIGMINRVTEDEEELTQESMKLVKRLAAGPSLAYRGLKEMFFTGEYEGLDSFITAETRAQARCEKTEDFREGIRAFLEKRKPVFRGR